MIVSCYKMRTYSRQFISSMEQGDIFNRSKPTVNLSLSGFLRFALFFL